jgi:hypothetical protein
VSERKNEGGLVGGGAVLDEFDVVGRAVVQVGEDGLDGIVIHLANPNVVPAVDRVEPDDERAELEGLGAGVVRVVGIIDAPSRTRALPGNEIFAKTVVNNLLYYSPPCF